LELVDVVLAELIVEEPISHTDQRLLGKDASEQQRPRICCGKKNGVDVKQSMDGPHHFSLKRWAAQSRVTATHQIIRAPRHCAASFHTAILLCNRVKKHPTSEGWWSGRDQPTMAA
jgi:hypothetical protein